MPNYDYECQKCGDVFEVFQTMTEPLIKKCPKCKGKVQRLIGAGMGVIFKGSGFYQTDYKPSKPAEKAKEPVPCQTDSAKPCASCPSAEK